MESKSTHLLVMWVCEYFLVFNFAIIVLLLVVFCRNNFKRVLEGLELLGNYSRMYLSISFLPSFWIVIILSLLEMILMLYDFNKPECTKKKNIQT